MAFSETTAKKMLSSIIGKDDNLSAKERMFILITLKEWIKEGVDMTKIENVLIAMETMYELGREAESRDW